MPFIVRLKKPDGKTLNLPELYSDPTPSVSDEITVKCDGAYVRAKVERLSQMHSTTGGKGEIQSLHIVIATQTDATKPAGEAET